ncbi:MAG TPA: response regulator [Tepidisphaeraceae bacterium]|jgi:FixJ family two-component response regulator
MSPTVPQEKLPNVLVVDDEPTLREVVGDLVAPQINCRVLQAKDLKEARAILEAEAVDVLLADIHLPDGDGMSLIADLQKRQPAATAIVITGAPSMDRAISAMRTGAIDFVPKPFSATHLAERVRRALAKNEQLVKNEKRMDRLRRAVHRLNQSRKTVSKKVDLLCNDLIGAYGELAKQLDSVRTVEDFRKYLDSAGDLEQLLCHSMDWLLRQLGYCNVAIWLASENNEFHLGAYMKYTIPGEPALADAMNKGLVPLTMRNGLVHLLPEDAADSLTADESQQLAGQEILSVSAPYLGEPLAAIILFRPAEKPFSAEDEIVLRAIAPVFAASLAASVRGGEVDTSEETGGGTKMEEEDRDEKDDSSDWWKSGGEPPF